MLIHLFDDEKFVDSTIDKFELVGTGKNRYIVFSNTKELNHPQNLSKIEILPNDYRKLDFNKIYNNCDVLAIQYLTPIKIHLLKHKPNHIKVIWMVWGKDAYDYYKSFQQYEKRTQKILRNDFKALLKTSFLYRVHHLMKYGVFPINYEKKALKNINYLATVLPTEFEGIKNEFQLNVEYVKFSYDSLTTVLLNDSEINLGKDIIVGNSATPTNNHLDIFHKIKPSARVLVPLNYGDMSYATKIEKEGYDIFGDSFVPIKEFFSFEDYKKLVFSCNTMIMYHIRQQGLGNILLALYGGIRVFLNQKSPLYSFLKNHDFYVFDLDKDFTLIGIELSSDEIQINRQKVSQYWGVESILEGTRNVMKIHENQSI